MQGIDGCGASFRPGTGAESQIVGPADTARGAAASARMNWVARTAPAMPSLTGVPTRYQYRDNSQLLLALALSLAELGVGSPDLWRIADGDALAFVEAAIRLRIARWYTDVLDRNVDYHLSIAHHLDGDVPAAAEKPQLYLTVEASACGYLKIGAALDALESEATGLGAAFYQLLLRTAWKWVRTYDHDAADNYVENLRECARQDSPEAMEQYEFPDVEGCVPASIRDLSRKSTLALWRIVSPHARGNHAGWITRLKRLHDMARSAEKDMASARKRNQIVLALGHYDGPPMPSLLVVMQENDAIETCFDEESPGWMEGTSEPAFFAAFDPRKSGEVAAALGMLERFLAANQELFRLVSDLNDWEKKCRERQSRHRGEPQLRTA